MWRGRDTTLFLHSQYGFPDLFLSPERHFSSFPAFFRRPIRGRRTRDGRPHNESTYRYSFSFCRKTKNGPQGGRKAARNAAAPRKKPPKGGYFLHMPKKHPPIPRLPAPRRGPRRPRRTTTARHPRLSCRPSPVCTPLPPGAPPRWTFFLFGHTTVRRTGTVSGSAGRLTAPLIFLKETQ